nr:facilitated trehalose transporter Tret1-like [Onthophagus taurus]
MNNNRKFEGNDKDKNTNDEHNKRYNEDCGLKLNEGESFQDKNCLDQNSTKEWFQILAVCSAAISSLSASILFTWTSPTIPILISNEFPNINIDLASYLTVIPPIVTILVSPFCSILTENYGRKYPLLAIGVCHICSWICIMLGEDIYIFYLSRIFFGIADAAMFGVLPVYIAEITTPKVRGTWGNAMGFGIFLGQLIMNTIGYYFDMKIAAYILVTIPISFLALFLTMPETPYFYLMKGKKEQAEKSLKQLRRSDNVSEELNRISDDVQKLISAKTSFKDCFSNKTNRKAVLLVTLARGIQQMSGISAFAVYTQLIFQEGMPEMDRGISSIIYTASLTIFAFFGSIICDKLGRKKSMVISSTGCALCLTAESVYFYLKQETSLNLTNISWFPIAGMILYVIVFCLGMGLTPMLLLSEMFSTSIRGKATGILTIIYCIYITITTKVFQLLTTNCGLFASFGMFAIFSYLSIILSYLYVPETKGKTLEEIQEILSGVKNVNKPV